LSNATERASGRQTLAPTSCGFAPHVQTRNLQSDDTALTTCPLRDN
jgi:hypothetical protein